MEQGGEEADKSQAIRHPLAQLVLRVDQVSVKEMRS